jgi:hypothetical protein
VPTLTTTQRGVRQQSLVINAADAIQVFRQLMRHPALAPLRRRSGTAAVRPQARPRGAGRPRAAATRSSAASGDSGDDGPGEPAGPVVETHWTPATADPARTRAARLSSLLFDGPHDGAAS